MAGCFRASVVFMNKTKRKMMCLIFDKVKGEIKNQLVNKSKEYFDRKDACLNKFIRYCRIIH